MLNRYVVIRTYGDCNAGLSDEVEWRGVLQTDEYLLVNLALKFTTKYEYHEPCLYTPGVERGFFPVNLELVF